MSRSATEGSFAGATIVAPARPSPEVAPEGALHIPSRKSMFTVALLGLVALAWLALWVWERSPYGRFLSHRDLEGAGLSDLARLTPLFVAGWTVMTVAMMLPTSKPVGKLFQPITSDRGYPVGLVGLLVAGYPAVLTLFGVVAHLGD